ncbi:tyrosine-protein kinase STYK1 isoform 2-T2 [Aulostomus maculatus]
MSSNSTTNSTCDTDDNLCIIRTHQQAVIIVPTLLLLATLVTLLALCLMRYCPRLRRTRTTAPRRFGSSTHRHQLQGIDAPTGLNPLEHEELPMSVHQGRRRTPAVPQIPTEGCNRAFSQVTALPPSLSMKPDATIRLYRARMDNRDVVLRVLKETANNTEQQEFLGFASFVAELGPHPFLPVLLGVFSAQAPLMVVMEDLRHRDLLGFLWRCRQEFLHSQRFIHGNVGARSILVGGDLTVKLWGLGVSYRRTQAGSLSYLEDTKMRKWEAPEVLARRDMIKSSDVWSFGILLYEMATLGDPPFAQLMASDILQHLQRGGHLQRPAKCSHSLYAIIRSCCRWSPQQRLSVSELIQRLKAGENSANGTTVLRMPEPLDIEKYLREAGYEEAYNFAVL